MCSMGDDTAGARSARGMGVRDTIRGIHAVFDMPAIRPEM